MSQHTIADFDIFADIFMMAAIDKRHAARRDILRGAARHFAIAPSLRRTARTPYEAAASAMRHDSSATTRTTGRF